MKWMTTAGISKNHIVAWNQLHFNFYMFALCLSMRDDESTLSKQLFFCYYSPASLIPYQTLNISSKSIISIKLMPSTMAKWFAFLFYWKIISFPVNIIEISAILETWSLLVAFFGIRHITMRVCWERDLLIQLECHSIREGRKKCCF